MSLDGYQRLILKMFPGSSDWRQRFHESRFRLLTFNYDRLFEMAVLNMFGINTNSERLYGEDILNSGFNHRSGPSIGFKDDRFCFLKLHGSVGMRVQEVYQRLHYSPYYDGTRPGEEIEMNDNQFFQMSGEEKCFVRDPELLIAFPFEKDIARTKDSKSDLAIRDYIRSVWGQAEMVMASATEIRFVGYSFAEMDRAAVVSLLSHAKQCRRVVIQNRPGEAERICEMLKMEHLELVHNFVPYGQEF